MTAITDDNIFGFYASFNSGEPEQELVKKYLWSDDGLKEKLKPLKWQPYGRDFHLILFEFYVKPFQIQRESLREIGNYRRKEKAIGIPIILDDQNFFDLAETERQSFLYSTIQHGLDLLKDKIIRNKLDLDIGKLKNDVRDVLRMGKSMQ